MRYNPPFRRRQEAHRRICMSLVTKVVSQIEPETRKEGAKIRSRGDVTEPAPELRESDRAPVGDEAQQAERVPATDELGERRRRAQAITVGKRSAASTGGLGHSPLRHSPPWWQSQSAEPHSPWPCRAR